MKKFFLRILVIAALILAGVSSLMFLSGKHTTFAAAPAVQTSQVHTAAPASTLKPAACFGAIVTTWWVTVTCYGPGTYSLSGVTNICATTTSVVWNGYAFNGGECESYTLDSGTLSV
jgi:hypothetical protein